MICQGKIKFLVGHEKKNQERKVSVMVERQQIREETTRADDTEELWGQCKCSKYPEEQPATIILQLLTVNCRERN